jgi:serine/threonine protein kinase
VWQELDHKNVVPLYGVVFDFGQVISMIMPEVGNTNLTRYLCQTEELSLSERFLLVSLSASLH